MESFSKLEITIDFVESTYDNRQKGKIICGKFEQV